MDMSAPFMAWRNLSKVRRLNQDCGDHGLQLSFGLVIYVAASSYLTGEQV